MASFRKFFIFNSWTNFSLFLAGVSGSSYIYLQHQNSKNFQHPVVNESIRVIEENNQVIELLGYPISLVSTFRNDAIVDRDNCDFSFQIQGPKGIAAVKVKGSSKPHGDIKQDKQIYYIPDPQIVDEIQRHKDNLSKIDLPLNQNFWRFDHLSVEVGSRGDFRLTLAESNDILMNKKIQSTQATDRKTLADINEEINARRKKAPTNEQEIEEQRRYRQNQLYQKIGNVRNVMLLATVILGMGTYVHLSRNKRVSIQKSQLHIQSLDVLRRSNYVQQVFGHAPKFNDQLRGAQVGLEAEFETDIIGNKQTGIAIVKGFQDSTSKNWQISSIEVQVKAADGSSQEKKKIL